MRCPAYQPGCKPTADLTSHRSIPARWLRSLDELMLVVGPRFCRVEPRRRARAFVLGLLADLPCKNCWSLAEHAGAGWPGMRSTAATRA